jgi:hypothetical protein
MSTRTRRVNSPPKGAEVIEADLDDETSLRKAFDGAYGVRNPDLVRGLNPELQPLDSWQIRHKTEIPLD